MAGETLEPEPRRRRQEAPTLSLFEWALEEERWRGRSRERLGRRTRGHRHCGGVPGPPPCVQAFRARGGARDVRESIAVATSPTSGSLGSARSRRGIPFRPPRPAAESRRQTDPGAPSWQPLELSGSTVSVSCAFVLRWRSMRGVERTGSLAAERRGTPVQGIVCYLPFQALRHTAAQLVAAEVQLLQVGEVTQLRRDLAAQLVAVEPEPSQVGEVTQLPAESPRSTTRFQAGPATFRLASCLARAVSSTPLNWFVVEVQAVPGWRGGPVPAVSPRSTGCR